MIHGGDIYRNADCIDFSANINPLGTPEMVKKAMGDSLNQVHNYPDISCEKLREKLGQFHKVKPEHVICGNGAADIIYRYVYALKPKSALVLAPCFAEYEQALHFVGTRVEHYVLDSNTFCLDECFLDVLTQELDVVFLCNPNNPTGKTIPQSLLLRMVERCRKKQIRLFLDECFLDFLEDEQERSLVNQTLNYPHIFILRSFTKMYGMPGIRLGYGICTDTMVLSKMADAGPPWNVSVPAQAAGVAALQQQSFVKKTRCYVKKERDYLTQQLSRLHITFWESSANYIFLYDSVDLKEKLLEKGILIRDCSNYVGLSKGYYRIAVKDRESNQKLITALENIKQNSVTSRETQRIGGKDGKVNYDTGHHVKCGKKLVGRRTL